MRALTWQRQPRRPRRHGRGPHHPGADRRDHPRDLLRPVRLGPAPVRGAGAFIDSGDILGHEPMGVVEAVGADVTHIRAGRSRRHPFNISCGQCFMCAHACSRSARRRRVHDYGTGAALLGYNQVVRAGRRRPGGVPARAAGAVRADQRCRTGRPTIASCSSATCCRPRGRRSSTPTWSAPTARCSCSAWARSAR